MSCWVGGTGAERLVVCAVDEAFLSLVFEIETDDLYLEQGYIEPGYLKWPRQLYLFLLRLPFATFSPVCLIV